MAKKTAGDALIERLTDWGVDTVFGLPGDGINGIMEGFPPPPEQGLFRPGASRGSGRLHGYRG